MKGESGGTDIMMAGGENFSHERGSFAQDEQCESYSLVLAWPLTGRMHQIRAHFAHLGFPLAGDVRYGPRRPTTCLGALGARLFLHAAYVFVSASLSGVSPLKADLLEPLKDTGHGRPSRLR